MTSINNLTSYWHTTIAIETTAQQMKEERAWLVQNVVNACKVNQHAHYNNSI